MSRSEQKTHLRKLWIIRQVKKLPSAKNGSIPFSAEGGLLFCIDNGSGIHKRRNRHRNHSANDQTNATYQTFSPLLFSDTPLPLPVCRILPGLSAAAKTERKLCLFFIINWLAFRMSPHREPCYNTNKPHCLSPEKRLGKLWIIRQELAVHSF